MGIDHTRLRAQVTCEKEDWADFVCGGTADG